MVRKDKGKARATELPTETSPLLGSPSRSPPTGDQPHPTHASGRGRRSTSTSVLYIALIVVLSLLAGSILFLALLVNSFRPTPTELDTLQDTAFQYSGPDGISIVNVTDDGVLVNVSLHTGIDWDRAAGIREWADESERQAAESRGDRGTGAEWWESLRRWAAAKAMARLDTRTVQVVVPEHVLVLPDHFTTFPLFDVSITQPIDIPLVAGVHSRRGQRWGRKDMWLRPTHVLALANPIASTADLLAFAQRAWEQGEVKVVIGVNKVQVALPLSGWLARFAKMEKEDITRLIQLPVPKLPGLPWPGKPLNLSSLVHLDSYTFNSHNDQLHVVAAASLPNLVPHLNTTLPFSLPFSIHLPDGQEMAQVVTAPVQLNNWSSRIDIHIDGVVVADLSGKGSTERKNETESDSALSHFLQNYLHGLDNPIAVMGLASLPSFARPDLTPPAWLLSTLPSLKIPLTFPGPVPKPKIIQSVTIEHMRLSEAGGKMQASGTVIAQISLPKGMESVDLVIDAVKPDILIYDGPPPDQDDGGEEGDDYPPRAFGHIHPDQWLRSTSERYQIPEHPDWITVRAPLEDVPVEILHGREPVMRAFVSKVVFKGGALAGIKGVADVKVNLKGVKGEVGLGGLPVKGEVWVGRQRALPWSSTPDAEDRL